MILSVSYVRKEAAMSAEQLETFIKCYMNDAEVAATFLSGALKEAKATPPADRLAVEQVCLRYEADFNRNSDAAIELLYCL